jgi:hypothetical protein
MQWEKSAITWEKKSQKIASKKKCNKEIHVPFEEGLKWTNTTLVGWYLNLLELGLLKVRGYINLRNVRNRPGFSLVVEYLWCSKATQEKFLFLSSYHCRCCQQVHSIFKWDKEDIFLAQAF